MSLIDLLHQVKARLPIRNGGTGNQWGWGRAVVVGYVNANETDDLPIGSVVRFVGTQIVDLVDSADSEDVLGVVVGYFRTSDRQLVESDCPPFAEAAVMLRGPCKLLIDADVDRLDYAYTSGSTDGYAYGDAALTTGAFGRFLTNGRLASGEDLVPFLVGLIGGGGGGGPGGSFTDAGVEATFYLPTGSDYVETRIQWDGTITGWYIFGDDPSGDAEVDIWVETPPTHPDVGDTITAAVQPTLTSDDYATGSPTGWTTGLTKGDLMTFSVNSVTGHQRLTIGLVIDRAS